MNKFLIITTLFNGAILIRFSLSKLFAWPISVAAFIEMAKPLGIDPTFFRVFTGIIITTVVVAYFTSLYFIVRGLIHKSTKALNFVMFSNLLGTGVMAGALLSEFFLRVTPKWPLVYIAAAIIIFSVTNLLYLRKSAVKA
ncbi:MAG: hypothetical protein KC478_13700 [Bacteriovoracaceae bacterium]|nr:hypothetical protein [Bacteriovoracaceae bacterium]